MDSGRNGKTKEVTKMYETTKNLMHMAKKQHTAVIAFICMDYTMARAVAYGAEAAGKPAIIMLYPDHVKTFHTAGFAGYAKMAKELAEEVSVPVGFHCDHDFSKEGVLRTVEAGFDSVMMDASEYDLEENIRRTGEVVEQLHEKGVSVEGEIGHVGLACEGQETQKDLYTKPEAARKFCEETKVDALAISIGNAHGAYKETPQLDMERLEAIAEATDTPLVLHGGSGIPDEQLQEAFEKGICKFNLGTDYLARYYEAVEDFIKKSKEKKDPVKVIEMPEFVIKRLTPYVEERLRTLCKFE